MLIICLCLDVWLCLKMGSENMVLVKLLQRGAKDLVVCRFIKPLLEVFSVFYGVCRIWITRDTFMYTLQAVIWLCMKWCKLMCMFLDHVETKKILAKKN